MDIGRGVVCDTAINVQRYANLRGDGTEIVAALQRINEGANNNACRVVLVLYTGGKQLGRMMVKGKTFLIMQITVHAIGSGAGWMQIPTVTQYTVVAEKGISV